jgi:hypothetical protein
LWKVSRSPRHWGKLALDQSLALFTDQSLNNALEAMQGVVPAEFSTGGAQVGQHKPGIAVEGSCTGNSLQSIHRLASD